MMREELYKLGFSKNEAAVYLLLFNLGTAVPSTLARMSGIKRPTVYAALKRLEARNLVYSYKKGKLAYFVIDDPNKIFLQEKEKFDAAKNLVEKIKESTKIMPSIIGVTYYQGAEGYREMYEDILKTKPKIVSVWMDLDGFLKGIDLKREEKWTKERVRNKIFARLLIQDTESGRKLKKKDKINCRETRLLHKEFFFQTTCILYDGKVNLFDTTEETTCICIQNPAFFQMFMALFEMTWGQ
jgi:sugar-specific transcriptional regulator TrmB